MSKRPPNHLLQALCDADFRALQPHLKRRERDADRSRRGSLAGVPAA
jgi:hypothetical protein